MFNSAACDLPADVLLRRYAFAGTYVDCFSTTVPMVVTLADYVQAFYTTPVFKLERAILARVVAKPSTDAQARQLAHSEIDAFAAWRVEDRNARELLMCDFRAHTRSWLMAVPSADGAASTRLLFGSAIVPTRKSDGTQAIGVGYRALLGFHVLYSKILLDAARRRLMAGAAHARD